ncbi:MAG: hypothetical protein Q8907_15135 [Bacteroidota bacterium]|nr:hypothetical protein [Bacteroidota bacterium]
MLQYNKIYQSLKKVSAEWHAGHVQWAYSWNYLKFYEDGTIIYCSSRGEPKDLIWFSKDNKSAVIYKGDFQIDSYKLSAKITMTIGQLKIDGIIHNQNLILRTNNEKLSPFENWDEYTPV